MMSLAFPLLHARAAYPTGWLHSDWRIEPTVILGVIALAALYVFWTGSKNRDAAGGPINPISTGQRVLFLSGLAVLAISLSPPLDDIADYYLLTAHMGQHLLLMFLAVPLLLLGTPGWLVDKLIAWRSLGRFWRFITRPLPAWLIANVAITVWHFPFAYDAAVRNEPIHVAQHLSFLLAATIAWWPVIGPQIGGQARLTPLLQCLYLFALSVPNGIVGAFITLSGPNVYKSYASAPIVWGISRSVDHEIAGLMMWVLTGVIYLAIITVVFFTWSSREEATDNAPMKRTPAAAPEAMRP